MLISKKDLLAETGISYGQLYRWKRERLIPEEWFIKQASFTGQETFFPREQILNRIQAIQELKDKYSLEELAKILSPEVADSGFSIEELQPIHEIGNEMIHTFQSILKKDNFSYIEVLLMVILSKVKEEEHLTLYQTGDLLEGMAAFLNEVKSTGYVIVIYGKDQDYYSVICQEQSKIYLDKRFGQIRQIRMDEISNDLKIRYRDIFDFHLNDSKQSQEEDSGFASREHTSSGKEGTSGETLNRDTKPGNNKETKEGKSKKDEDDSNIVFRFNNWEVRL